MYYQGRLLITPKNPNFAPFEYPKEKDKEGFFCTKDFDGDIYYYTGKSQASAGSSYSADIVTVLSQKEVNE